MSDQAVSTTHSTCEGHADPRPHVPALDGVRGLAVLMVVVLHAMLIVPRQGGVDYAAWQMLRGGWIGVDLFFVLSGFLITGILFDAKGQRARDYFINFYARRTLRIAPLYYGYLAFYFFALPRVPVPGFHEYYIEPDVRPMFWFYLYNFWAAEHGGMHGNLGVFWSLCVEEHFYLVWPLVIWLLSRAAAMRLCVILIGFSLLARVWVIREFPNDHAAYLLTPCRLDGLCAGSLLALALRDPIDWQRLMRPMRYIAVAAGAFVLGMGAGQRHFIDNVDFHDQPEPGVDSGMILSIGLSVLAIGFASIVALTVDSAADPASWAQRVFRNPVLRSLGVYSYAMYIFHPLIISLTKRGLGGMGFTFPEGSIAALASRITMALAILGVTYLVAFVSYHLYERHFLALKRFFPPSKRPVALPAPAGAGEASQGR